MAASTTVVEPVLQRARKRRVLVVDDASVVRGIFARWIDAEPDLEVAGTALNGRDAVDRLGDLAPDVVVLDIDMPEMDGLTALPLLLRKRPDLIVIMASTLTRRSAEFSLRALSLGAADYLPKPEARDFNAALSFRRELIDKIRQLPARSGMMWPADALRVESPSLVPNLRPVAEPAIALRPFSPVPPRALLIGASTGGPQALTTLLPELRSIIDEAPVIITQHMPPVFTAIFAEHLQRVTERPVREASDGMEVCAGVVHLAPGGRHLRLQRQDGRVIARLDDGAPVNFCKPAVDPMFADGAAVWRNATLGLILTGMGSDGMRGAQAIAAAGGSVIAQDEATSVVWGMPRQAATSGACSAVLPLAAISNAVLQLFAGRIPGMQP